jgi:hypothetical protein
MYASVGQNQLLVADRGGVQLDLVTLGDNRLSMASLDLVQSTWSSAMYAQAVVWTPVAPFVAALASVPDPSPDLVPDPSLDLDLVLDVNLLDVLAASAAHQRVLLASADGLCFGESPLAAFHFSTVPSSTTRFEHYTAEQRARCDRVLVVHSFMHIGDETLCQAVDGGAYAWANITSADVRLNRRLRGPCV